MILGETLGFYLGFPLAQAERRLAEGDGGTVRSARRLGRDVVMGAPTEPTAVAVPVTNPTRESEVKEREREKDREGWWERTQRAEVIKTSWKSQTLRQCHPPQS